MVWPTKMSILPEPRTTMVHIVRCELKKWHTIFNYKQKNNNSNYFKKLNKGAERDLLKIGKQKQKQCKAKHQKQIIREESFVKCWHSIV